LLAATEEEPLAETERVRDLGDALLRHDLGARHRELALLEAREPLHEKVPDDQAKHRVPEELEALVVRPVRARILVHIRLVGERRLEERPVFPGVPDLAFEELVASRLHWFQYIMRPSCTSPVSSAPRSSTRRSSRRSRSITAQRAAGSGSIMVRS